MRGLKIRTDQYEYSWTKITSIKIEVNVVLTVHTVKWITLQARFNLYNSRDGDHWHTVTTLNPFWAKQLSLMLVFSFYSSLLAWLRAAGSPSAALFLSNVSITLNLLQLCIYEGADWVEGCRGRCVLEEKTCFCCWLLPPGLSLALLSCKIIAPNLTSCHVFTWKVVEQWLMENSKLKADN